MLIKSSPDRYDKLRTLGGMVAADDILTGGAARSENAGSGKFASGYATSGPNRVAYSDPRKNPTPGIYKSSLPNGKKISLLRVMFTDFCKMDCAYCPNSIYVPRKRYAFKREELADTFMELHNRLAVDGLFLSSGIAGDGTKTTQRMVETVEIIRKKHGFRGYIHLKVMPGASRELVERAHRLGSRLSVNIETPEPDMLRRISPHKDLQRDILDPMSWINELTASTNGGAVGQATQFVVGAADESDRQIYRRVDQMYTDWNLKRVYYPPFRPATHTPMEEKPPVPARREHRLYQMDWLRRVYRLLQRRDRPGLRPRRLPVPGAGPQDGHRHGEPRRLPHRPQHRITRSATAHPRHRSGVRRPHPAEPPPAQHRQLARPADHGRGTEAGLALRRVPRPAPAVRPAAPPGPVRRSGGPPRRRGHRRQPASAQIAGPVGRHGNARVLHTRPRVRPREQGSYVRRLSGEPGYHKSRDRLECQALPDQVMIPSSAKPAISFWDIPNRSP